MKPKAVSLEEFLDHVTIQAVMCNFSWVYMPAPRLVIEQRNGMSFFLRPNSNKWEFLPKH